jgi:hypothetical protein
MQDGLSCKALHLTFFDRFENSYLNQSSLSHLAMLSLYLGQVTWLHRIPAGWKLLALALASVLLLPVTHLWVLAGATFLLLLSG